MKERSLLITGGLGFLGSWTVEEAVRRGYKVIVVDALTYAANPENLSSLKVKFVVPSVRHLWGVLRVEDRRAFPVSDPPNYDGYGRVEDVEREVEEFLSSPLDALVILASVEDYELMKRLMPYVEGVIHLAAETHVDRSIEDAWDFVRAEILGFYSTVDAFRRVKGREGRFLLVSTDEVLGEVMEGALDETAPLMPRNPYAAAKSSQEHFAQSYINTYGLPITIVRPTNAYGPRQHPEKFVPKIIINALRGLPIPVYGDGRQRRVWIYAPDVARGIMDIYERGNFPDIYHIGSMDELENLALVRKILRMMGKGEDLITFVEDRPGHDRRYSLNWEKMRRLGWYPKVGLDEGLLRTIEYYAERYANRPSVRR